MDKLLDEVVDWEKLRQMTLDGFVTLTKLNGSVLLLGGFTTPERWPFTITVAVGSPGNEAVIPLTKKIQDSLAQLKVPIKEAIANPDIEY